MLNLLKNKTENLVLTVLSTIDEIEYYGNRHYAIWWVKWPWRIARVVALAIPTALIGFWLVSVASDVYRFLVKMLLGLVGNPIVYGLPILTLIVLVTWVWVKHTRRWIEEQRT